jgi:hypothetical protein
MEPDVANPATVRHNRQLFEILRNTL